VQDLLLNNIASALLARLDGDPGDDAIATMVSTVSNTAADDKDSATADSLCQSCQNFSHDLHGHQRSKGSEVAGRVFRKS